jgi:hypothetical protein
MLRNPAINVYWRDVMRLVSFYEGLGFRETFRTPTAVVPRVFGLTLRMARTRIRAKHRSVGRIRRARSSRVGGVIAQSPRPGRRLTRGSRVNLVVGRRRGHLILSRPV